MIDLVQNELQEEVARTHVSADHEVLQACVAQTPIGFMLVAASKAGLRWVEFGDDVTSLESSRVERFPNAVEGFDEPLGGWLTSLQRCLEHPETELKIPLDVEGTAFQQVVWKALRGIPAGSTVSYAELARRVGKPAAVRAVANACGANDLAIAIPCHRVIRSDGSLGGYRWGLERKRALLALEGSLS
jgi:AraC family transcriptional regulator of adaptative response/methylated-DNA-[protein]-cysteine methyltransferase